MAKGVPARTLAFSHVGFYVRDLAKMRDFYKRVLGFVETDHGEVRGHPICFLSRDPAEHHQIVLVEGRTVSADELMLNQISMRVDSLDELRGLAELVENERHASDLNPVSHGNAWSIYFRDPEGNRIEVFTDSPWYVAQPCLEPLDLSKPDDEILRETEAAICDMPGFQPAEAWRSGLAKRIEAALGD
jgi:catechol 2,3-dioxygenase-like lactoylglutathione lyase family enzyme